MMLYLIVLIYAVYLGLDMISEHEESLAMAYVGPIEFNKNKQSMPNKEFKKYVWDNAAKMRKAMNDAAEKYNKDKK